MISKGLYEILKQWQTDATSAEPSFDAQTRGLCHYIGEHGSVCAQYEFNELLYAEFANKATHPFNTTIFNYFRERGLRHRNPARLAWVQAKLAEYEEAHNGTAA